MTDQELKQYCGAVTVPDREIMDAARRRQAELAKPPGSLGKLEDYSIRLAGITGQVRPHIEKCRVLVLAADNGVTAEELLVISRHPAHFVCVCDELWRDGVTYETWTETYRRGLAEICRRLAAEFDVVCELTAGLPRLWKGAWRFE